MKNTFKFCGLLLLIFAFTQCRQTVIGDFKRFTSKLENSSFSAPKNFDYKKELAKSLAKKYLHRVERSN